MTVVSHMQHGVREAIRLSPARCRVQICAFGDALLALFAALLWAPGLGCGQVSAIADIMPAADASTNAAVDSPVDLAAGDAPSSLDTTSDSNASACGGRDLSNVGSGDFVVSFTLQTTQKDQVISLVNQRLLCGNGIFWDVRLVSGLVYLEIADIDHGLTFLMSQGPTLFEGKPHAIVISRAGGTARIDVDGAPSGSIATPQSMTQLPPLKVGTDVCLGVNGTVALQGSLTNLCVMSR